MASLPSEENKMTKRNLAPAAAAAAAADEEDTKIEWPASLDEYEKLVMRMTTPRSVLSLPVFVCVCFSSPCGSILLLLF